MIRVTPKLLFKYKFILLLILLAFIFLMTADFHLRKAQPEFNQQSNIKNPLPELIQQSNIKIPLPELIQQSNVESPVKVYPNGSISDPIVGPGSQTIQKQGSCSSLRNVMVTAFPKHYKIFLHPVGQDIWVSDSFHSPHTATFFENDMRIKMERVITKKSLIFDIGANIGIHTLYFASIGHEIHAFEPLRKNYELLECSIQANQFTNVKLNKFGLSDKSGSVCMNSEPKNVGHTVISKETNCNEKMKTEVLGDYLEKELKGRVPDLIKIDIEGWEYFALESSQGYFKKHGSPKYIFSEYAEDNLKPIGMDGLKYLKMMEQMGYETWDKDMRSRLDIYEYAKLKKGMDDVVFIFKN